MAVTIITPQATYLDINDENSYTLSWACDDMEQSGYEIQYKPKYADTWSTLGYVQSIESTYDLRQLRESGLSDFKEYYYRVAVVDSYLDADGLEVITKQVSEAYSIILKGETLTQLHYREEDGTQRDYLVMKDVVGEDVDCININVDDERKGKIILVDNNADNAVLSKLKVRDRGDVVASVATATADFKPSGIEGGKYQAAAYGNYAYYNSNYTGSYTVNYTGVGTNYSNRTGYRTTISYRRENVYRNITGVYYVPISYNWLVGYTYFNKAYNYQYQYGVAAILPYSVQETGYTTTYTNYYRINSYTYTYSRSATGSGTGTKAYTTRYTYYTTTTYRYTYQTGGSQPITTTGTRRNGPFSGSTSGTTPFTYTYTYNTSETGSGSRSDFAGVYSTKRSYTYTKSGYFYGAYGRYETGYGYTRESTQVYATGSYNRGVSYSYNSWLYGYNTIASSTSSYNYTTSSNYTYPASYTAYISSGGTVAYLTSYAYRVLYNTPESANAYLVVKYGTRDGYSYSYKQAAYSGTPAPATYYRRPKGYVTYRIVYYRSGSRTPMYGYRVRSL